MNLAKLGVNFVRRQKRYRQKQEKLQAEIDRMNKRYHAQSLQKAILQPIAKAILEELTPDFKSFEIMGPFGLCCEYSVRFYKTEGNDGRKRGLNTDHNSDEDCISLSFVDFDHETGQLRIRDYTRNRKEFKSGTIGEMNGMNFENIEVPPDADAKWFVRLLVAMRLRDSA